MGKRLENKIRNINLIGHGLKSAIGRRLVYGSVLLMPFGLLSCGGGGGDSSGSNDGNSGGGTEPTKYTYYEDYDEDGAGNPNKTTTTTDSQPPTGFVKNKNDCNDRNAKEYPGQIWGEDIDGDTYPGRIVNQCEQLNEKSRPASELESAIDCNDTKPEINPNTKRYKDWDGDFESDGTYITQCEASDDYYLESELDSIDGDCNDEDIEINSKTIRYKDKDKDGYWDGINTITQCEASDDYFLASELAGPEVDLDDDNQDISPGLEEVCFDGIDNNSNGETDEGCVLPASWDWRWAENSEGVWGNYMTSVKMQDGLSCGLYSTIGAIETQMNITNSTPGMDRDLSEDYLVCQGVVDPINGIGGPRAVLDFGIIDGFANEGDVSEECVFSSGIEDRLSFVEDYHSIGDENWAYLTNEEKIELTKKALMHGPLIAQTWMSGEFDSLGIYRCDGVYDDNEKHDTIITGYDEDTKSWISKNSLGENWNGDGYYNVGFNECRILRAAPIAVDVEKEE